MNASLSSGQVVRNCVSWGMVLRPKHYTIQMKNMNEGTEGIAVQFVDDTKIGRKLSCEENI